MQVAVMLVIRLLVLGTAIHSQIIIFKKIIFVQGIVLGDVGIQRWVDKILPLRTFERSRKLRIVHVNMGLNFKLESEEGSEALGVLGQLRGWGCYFQPTKQLLEQRYLSKDPKDSLDVSVYNWRREKK